MTASGAILPFPTEMADMNLPPRHAAESRRAAASRALAEEDYRKLLDLLHELYHGLALHMYPGATLRVLHRLVPALFASYEEVESRTTCVRRVCEPEKYAQRKRRRPASGEVTGGQMQTGTEDQAWLDSLGIRDTLRFSLNPSPSIAISFSLHRRDGMFTDRDHAITSLLQPHLAHAYQLAVGETERQAVELLSRRDAGAARDRDHGVLLAQQSGKIVHANRKALAQLRGAFPHAAEDVLPKPILRWLRSRRTGAANNSVEDLEINETGVPLTVRAGAAEGDHWLLVLAEQEAALAPALLQERFRLTRRESELLYWLAKGRSNRDMAVIFGISARTVEKHMQHLFEKLDVDSRHAAVMKAMPILGLS